MSLELAVLVLQKTKNAPSDSSIMSSKSSKVSGAGCSSASRTVACSKHGQLLVSYPYQEAQILQYRPVIVTCREICVLTGTSGSQREEKLTSCM